MLHNYHTHTFRCGHAAKPDREYIENAIKLGMKTLGFADHAPQIFPGTYKSGFRMETETFPEYVQTLTALREEYKNDIDIKIGIETEYYPALFADLLDLIRANGGIDYMILGQHFLDNEYDTRLYNGNATTDESRLAHYTAQVLEGLRTGCFSYVAHPDLIRYEGDLAIYRRHILPFCEGVKELGYPLEINFLGLMDSRHYPREDFFRIAAEVGNDVIFGMDAHSPGAMLRKDVLEKAHDFCDRLGLHVVENVTLRRPV